MSSVSVLPDQMEALGRLISETRAVAVEITAGIGFTIEVRFVVRHGNTFEVRPYSISAVGNVRETEAETAVAA